MCEKNVTYTCPDWESNPPAFLVYGMMMLQATEPHWQGQNLSFAKFYYHLKDEVTILILQHCHYD